MSDSDQSSSSSSSSPEEDVETGRNGRAARVSVVSFADVADEIMLTRGSLERHNSSSSHQNVGTSDKSVSTHEAMDTITPMTGAMAGGIDRRASLMHTESRRRMMKKEASRKSLKTDLATGIQGGARIHTAKIRHTDSMNPCGSKVRRRQTMKRVMSPFAAFGNTELEEPEEELKVSFHGRLAVEQLTSSSRQVNSVEDLEFGSAHSGSVQYRLKAIEAESGRWGAKVRRFMGLSESAIYEGASSVSTARRRGFLCCRCTPNDIVMRYLHWTFRTSFIHVLFSGALAFLVLTMLFGIFIWALGLREPSCIGGVNKPPDGSDYFSDAWTLSWTTFSTVGYGLVYSGISADEPDIRKCTGITIIVTLEAFMGVLFASLCGAILFAKVARIQSFAQVVFSDPVTIRYGPGVMVECDGAGSDDDASVDSTELSRIPCPVLEFRIANRLHSQHGGEIIDATINIVASIDASQACPTVRGAANRRRRGKKGKKGGPSRVRRPPPLRAGSGAGDAGDEAAAAAASKEVNEKVMHRTTSTGSLKSVDGSAMGSGAKTHQSFDEDPTGHLVPRRIFSKLECESMDHPFFKRVWVIRHTINAQSPLLKASARQMVKRHNGYWPHELNSHEGVRAAVYFEQILVSMSGTSNADRNSVYAQKVYDFEDVCVGYRFVNPLYRDESTGGLHVDMMLLNDVTEQAGGGGEPFSVHQGVTNASDMFVL